ncbi:MAG: ergothioneine biosynthesis protein EgtB [Planctomycetota bacterium]
MTAPAFSAVRGRTLKLIEPLSPEDACAQSMTACSPAKWHLAHTTWFFDVLVLDAFGLERPSTGDGLRVLFNSYYNALGSQFDKSMRGALTRPALDEVIAYRAQIDAAIARAIESGLDDRALAAIELGLHHEMQHQELLLADIKHLFSVNPLRPAYLDAPLERAAPAGPTQWRRFEGGLRSIGRDAESDGFAYDCEGPEHPGMLHGFELADRCVTNAEWLEFIADGGYQRPELWLDDGWKRARAEDWSAPLYWSMRDAAWDEFTLRGPAPLDPDRPVCHVSYFEADAFARWAGARLPTEFEWESAAVELDCEASTCDLLEGGELHPRVGEPGAPLRAALGGVWEWTASDYAPYPGYAIPAGAVGEYNAKFMHGRRVLRGGCCATPMAHVRASYRNYYAPDDRWPFAGVRLARQPQATAGK